MRLVFLQKNTDSRGGSKASLRNTLSTLRELPDTELELWGESPGPLSEFAESLGVSFEVTPFPRWRHWADRVLFSRTMWRFAQSCGQPDWIISNEMWWAPHAWELARHCGSRSAVIVRDEIADLKKAKQYSFQKMDQVIAVSEDLKNLLRDDIDLYAKTQTIYNIVERPRADDETSQTLDRQCAQFPNVTRWVLSAGTICPRKDQVLLVRALAELIRRGDTGTGIVFVGGHDGSGYEGTLKQEVSNLGLNERVLYTGQLPEIGSALERAAAFALTSRSEGLPRVLIESALAQVPSVSTAVSGVAEVYGEGVTRHVMQTREPVELADKLQGILAGGDDADIELLAARMKKKFSRESHLQSWKRCLGLDGDPEARF